LRPMAPADPGSSSAPPIGRGGTAWSPSGFGPSAALAPSSSPWDAVGLSNGTSARPLRACWILLYRQPSLIHAVFAHFNHGHHCPSDDSISGRKDDWPPEPWSETSFRRENGTVVPRAVIRSRHAAGAGGGAGRVPSGPVGRRKWNWHTQGGQKQRLLALESQSRLGPMITKIPFGTSGPLILTRAGRRGPPRPKQPHRSSGLSPRLFASGPASFSTQSVYLRHPADPAGDADGGSLFFHPLLFLPWARSPRPLEGSLRRYWQQKCPTMFGGWGGVVGGGGAPPGINYRNCFARNPVRFQGLCP